MQEQQEKSKKTDTEKQLEDPAIVDHKKSEEVQKILKDEPVVQDVKAPEQEP